LGAWTLPEEIHPRCDVGHIRQLLDHADPGFCPRPGDGEPSLQTRRLVSLDLKRDYFDSKGDQ